MRMKICCYIVKASDVHYEEYRVFNSWKELLEFMKKQYDRWVLRFLDMFLARYKDPYYKEVFEKLQKAFGECSEYLYMIIYDDYIE